MKKIILIIAFAVLSNIIFAQSGKWTAGISVAPIMQLNKHGNSFFDFEIDKWDLHNRGYIVGVNSNYYFNDKWSILLNVGTTYFFYDYAKHGTGVILFQDYSSQQFKNSEMFTLFYAAGIMYDFYNINDKWNFGVSSSLDLHNLIYKKIEYINYSKIDRCFDFSSINAKLGFITEYKINPTVGTYLKTYININILNNKIENNPVFYEPNLHIGINFNLNKK